MGNQLREEASRAWPELLDDQLSRLQAYYDLLVTENERQNLTRLISPTQFVEGHLIDVREMFKSTLVTFPAADLGSGGGVPGLLAAVLQPGSWLLLESEGRKAEFLKKAAEELRLEQVQVFLGRGEETLKSQLVETVVVRAVGPLTRLYRYLKPCSTWNHLLLFKGPRWAEEWKEFQRTSMRDQLNVTGSHLYRVAKEDKQRLIVRLSRVLRGTNSRR